jgi:hypothetical protein
MLDNIPKNINNRRSHYPISAVIFCFLLLIFPFIVTPAKAQEIEITGKAMDKYSPSLFLEQVMVINLRTQQGYFGNPDNTFSIRAEKNDTIIVTAYGYQAQKICFRDSSFQENYKIIVGLTKISASLQEITVMAPRDLNRIEEDIKKLGYNKREYRLTGVAAWQSPLTALYEEFSRRERSRRKVAELMNDDERRALLREVLANYSRSGLIKMQYHEYNAFIDYLGLNDFLLKSFTQYELAVFIKNKYLSYSNE